MPLSAPPDDLLSDLTGGFVRLDATAPEDWTWEPFPAPRHRFDSASGGWRVRYASTTGLGVARERYRDTGSFVPAAHAGHKRVDLEGTLRVLDLRDGRVLDALRADARIGSSYEDPIRQACWKLTDRVREWWGETIHGIAYEPRTTPKTAINVAFFEHAPLVHRSARLDTCDGYLDELVTGWGFTVAFPYPR